MSEIERRTSEVSIEAPQTQNVLEKKFERNSKGDTSPTVLNTEKLIFKNTAPLVVTKFDDGQPNQEISILGDGFTTIKNNAFIQTATGADELLTVGLVYRFSFFAGKWHEDAGSGGGGGGAGPTGPTGAPGKTTIIIPEPQQPLEPMMIPGSRGVAGGAGATGATGKAGRDIVGLDGRDAVEPPLIPGRDGKAGVAGSPGAAGKTVVVPGIDGRDAEPTMVIPGQAGRAGTSGAAGKTVIIPGIDGLPGQDSWIPGPQGPFGPQGAGINYQGVWDPAFPYFENDVVRYHGKLYIAFKHDIAAGTVPTDPASFWLLFLEDGFRGPPGVWANEPAQPLEPMMVPGQRGLQGPAGVGAFTLLTSEVALRVSPACARGGKFQIAGAGMTPGKPVLIQQAAGPYTGKGTRADEAEMDNIEVRAYVLDATHIQAYWSSRTRVRGNFKFNYAVSA